MEYNSVDTMKKIEQITLQQGKSVRGVLERSGLSRSTVTVTKNRQNWIKVDSLAKIADELDCSVDYLLGRTENEKLFSKDETQFLESLRKLSVFDKAEIVCLIKDKLDSKQQ